ncbi:hypothetical protein COO60DRAFT_616901 [Scenedesmus sp. NREL 46B-D3]|nr:hypothetical protein COO60DRAFT_616901 [Scenedesmus sp. NREL 46B-D3]
MQHPGMPRAHNLCVVEGQRNTLACQELTILAPCKHNATPWHARSRKRKGANTLARHPGHPGMPEEGRGMRKHLGMPPWPPGMPEEGRGTRKHLGMPPWPPRHARSRKRKRSNTLACHPGHPGMPEVGRGSAHHHHHHRHTDLAAPSCVQRLQQQHDRPTIKSARLSRDTWSSRRYMQARNLTPSVRVMQEGTLFQQPWYMPAEAAIQGL